MHYLQQNLFYGSDFRNAKIKIGELFSILMSQNLFFEGLELALQ